MTMTEDYILDKLQKAIDNPDKWTFDAINNIGCLQNRKEFHAPYMLNKTLYFYNVKTDRIELYGKGLHNDVNKLINLHQFCFGSDSVHNVANAYTPIEHGEKLQQQTKTLLQKEFNEYKNDLRENHFSDVIRHIAESDDKTDKDDIVSIAGIISCKTVPLDMFTKDVLIINLLKYLKIQFKYNETHNNVPIAMRTLSQLVKVLDKSSMELVNICQECGNECDSLKLKMKLKLINLQLQRKL